MKIKNLTNVYLFCGYGEPSFGLEAGVESETLSDGYGAAPSHLGGTPNPALLVDIDARRIEVSQGRRYIRLVNESAVSKFLGYQEPSFQLGPGATSQDLPAAFLDLPAVVADIAAGIISVAPSENTDIRSTDETKVYDIEVVDLTLEVSNGLTAGLLKSNVTSTDGTTQAEVVTDAGGAAQLDAHVLVTGDKLKITAEDTTTIVNYVITVAA